jgi:hypothetical protein
MGMRRRAQFILSEMYTLKLRLDGVNERWIHKPY